MCGSMPLSIPSAPAGHNIVDLARRVAEGGATLVQLRDKGSETRAMVDDSARDQGGAFAIQDAFRRQ